MVTAPASAVEARNILPGRDAVTGKVTWAPRGSTPQTICHLITGCQAHRLYTVTAAAESPDVSFNAVSAMSLACCSAWNLLRQPANSCTWPGGGTYEPNATPGAQAAQLDLGMGRMCKLLGWRDATASPTAPISPNNRPLTQQQERNGSGAH